MTRHEIARLACRLMALYLLAQTVAYFGTVVLWLASAVMTGGGGGQIWIGQSLSQLAPCIAYGVVGLLLWKKSDWIATRLLGEHLSDVSGFEVRITTTAGAEPLDASPSPNSPQVHHFGLGASDWTVIGFMVAGVFILTEGLNALGGVVYIALSDFRTYQAVHNVLPDGAISAVLKTAIGLWLLLGSRGIVGMVRTLRTKYAVKAAEELTEASEES